MNRKFILRRSEWRRGLIQKKRRLSLFLNLRMGSPEFPDLGKHCADSDCKLVDFLPFTCDRCYQVRANQFLFSFSSFNYYVSTFLFNFPLCILFILKTIHHNFKIGVSLVKSLLPSSYAFKGRFKHRLNSSHRHLNNMFLTN